MAAAAALSGGAPWSRCGAASDGRRRSLLHLPPDIRDFTGRAEQVDQVIRLIVAAVGETQAALPIVCLSGQGGAGKTTLAIHVAHRIGGDFPDGQLYTNLRGAEAADRTRRTSWPDSFANSGSTAPTSPRASTSAPACTGRSWQASASWWCSTTPLTRRRSGRCCRGAPDARSW